MIKETQHKIKMKKLSNIIILAMMAVMLAACSGENQEARTPVASITVNADRLEINQSMEIRFNGVADQVVIFTGDNGHDYDLRNESNTGFVMNKGLFTYSYSVPGKFKVVCVATTYDTYMGDNMKTDITTFEVTVSDDVTTIDKVSSSIIDNIMYDLAVQYYMDEIRMEPEDPDIRESPSVYFNMMKNIMKEKKQFSLDGKEQVIGLL